MMSPEELDHWFENVCAVLSTAYLSHKEPWKQSGMSGPEERWTALRRPVADCIDRPGTFLDIGCANGYLIECCVRWTLERGIRIEPYGLDLSPELAALARQRLPQYADRIYIDNSFYWMPPLKFDFVRTELVYVPGEYERQYVAHLLRHYLNSDGKLLVANYAEDLPDPTRGLMSGSYPARHILDHLAELGYNAIGYKDGYDPVKDRKVRVAILSP